jgi:uncharacterized protein (TIGR02246 family)
MRKKLMSIVAVASAVAAISIGTMSGWPGQEKAPSAQEKITQGEGQKASPDEAAIRKTAADFIKAFNAADANAVAAFWTKEGEYLQANGDELKGRDAIRKDFAEFFKDNPKATIEINIQSIRFLGKYTALEEGTTRVRTPGDKTPSESSYSVLHVRDDDGWHMASLREWVPDATPSASLADLGWLIGEWTAKGKEAEVRVTYAWDEDKTTIRGRYTLTKNGKVIHSGAHIFGNDPANGLRAWVFDSTGTFGESYWWCDGEKWTIEATGTLPNGSEVSAMNILVPINNDTFTWQSVERVVAGTEVPDVEPVRVMRVKK